MKKTWIAAVISSICLSGNATTFKSLSDDELSKVDGRALLNFTKDMETYKTNSNEVVSFYKLGLDAEK